LTARVKFPGAINETQTSFWIEVKNRNIDFPYDRAQRRRSKAPRRCSRNVSPSELIPEGLPQHFLRWRPAPDRVIALP
jgi:hypothetical protein